MLKEIKEYNLIKPSFILWVAGLLLFSLQEALAQVTTGTLVEEMVNLKKLAEYPEPYYNTIQFSSYDRRSTFSDEPGWFNNSDGFGGEPIPGFEKILRKPDKNGIGEYLICHVKGPGAIVRLWTATIKGDVRLYLDGDTKPVYSGNAFDFFTKTYNAIIKNDSINLKGSLSQNMAGYYPIPFAKQCKIIWKGNINAAHFYHVNVRTYEKGTKVRTFESSDIKTYSKEIENTHNGLSNSKNKFLLENAEIETFAANVKSGVEQEILNISGSKGVKLLEMSVLGNSLETVLRQTILRISFDGASDPQVQSPLGDFFCTAAGINPYESLPLSVTKDGRMICRFYMPFKESASIIIENLGDKDAILTGKVVTEKYRWIDELSMYFRARWRITHGLVASRMHPNDITYLHTSGKGVCVGAAAHMLNPSNVPSISGNWWGEGDEKIFVDENTFPVFFGTGSEDYFNYAWSSPDIFDYAYCGQTRDDGPGTRGFITNYRWHIIDNIPFKRQFAFYMELLSHGTVPDYSYARIIYHYGFKGMHDDNNRITKEDVRHLKLPENWFPTAYRASSNSLFYQAEDLVSNKVNTDVMSGALWSGGQLLEWCPKQESEKLKLNLPIIKDGNYVIYITARLTDDSGSIKAKINDSVFNKKGGEIHLKTSGGALSRTFQSAPVELKKGKQKLILESFLPNKLIGIDFIWIQKK